MKSKSGSGSESSERGQTCRKLIKRERVDLLWII